MTGGVRDALFLAVLFVANVVQAITGFAGTVLAMPASMLLIGADEARVTLNVMAFLSCLWLGAKYRRHIRWVELARMAGFMAVGMAVGIAMYQWLPLVPLRRAYGVFIVAVAAVGLFHPPRRAPRPWTMVVILLAAGVVHGLFVSGGALLVVYAAARLPDKDEFRATVSCVWVVLNAVMGVQQAAAGDWTLHALLLTALGIPVLVLAVVLGDRLQRRISQRAFLRLTYALLAVSGVSILW